MDEKQIVNRFLESIRRLQLRMTRSVSKSIMRRAIYFFLLLCLIFPAVAKSQPWWSVGPKLGYILGDKGGFAWGFEVTYFPQYIAPAYGYTCDLTFWRDYSSLHFGIEFANVLSIDVGPTLFYTNKKLEIGLSGIPWFGVFCYAYYEFAWPIGQTLIQSYGGYLKIPIGATIN